MAMTEFVLEFNVSNFRGKPEDVPTAEGVDVEDIKAADPNALYVTLPIAEIGAISGNGLLYDEALVDSLAAQINADRPGGIFGHLKDEERSTSFPLPAGMWVGAKRVGETLWAKAYIPPSAARDYVQNLKRVGGQIATSIYGKGTYHKVREGVRRLTDFKLESLDFAPPSRAALGMGAVPYVTSEMKEHATPFPTTAVGNGGIKEATMPDKTEVLKELREVAVPPNRGWRMPAQVQEMQEDALAPVREMLGVDSTTDVVALIRELKQQTEALTQAAIKNRIGVLVSEGVHLPSARGIVTKLINAADPRSVEEAETIYTQVVEMEEVKELLTLAVRSASGPAAIVNGKVQANNGRLKLEDTPENRQRAAARMGINL
jgi:hypothetical protein